MKIPEYLSLFSNQGDIEAEVKFKYFDGKVANVRMTDDEILKIINPYNNELYTEMRFEDWLFEIYKYQIDPIKKELRIMARKS